MSFALSLAALLATSAPPEPQIMGHYFACSATLKLMRGTITVGRSLQEDGKMLYESDTGSWEPADQSSGYIHWSDRPSRGPGALRLTDILAYYTVYVRTERRLPKVTQWNLTRPGQAVYDSFSLPMTTGADRRQGSTGVPLRVLLAYAVTADSLSWTVRDVPDPYGIGRQHAQGTLNAAALREAAEAIPKAEAMLDALAADPAQRCKLMPVYYDPLSEI